MDASVIDTTFWPKGKTNHKVTEDYNEEEIVVTKNIPLKADKGYQSKKNVELLKQQKLKNHILKKAYKNKLLTRWEKKFDKLIGKTRF